MQDSSSLLGAWSCTNGELGRGGDIFGLVSWVIRSRSRVGSRWVLGGWWRRRGGLADPVLWLQEWDRKAEDARRDYEKAMKEYSKADSHRG